MNKIELSREINIILDRRGFLDSQCIDDDSENSVQIGLCDFNLCVDVLEETIHCTESLKLTDLNKIFELVKQYKGDIKWMKSKQ